MSMISSRERLLASLAVATRIAKLAPHQPDAVSQADAHGFLLQFHEPEHVTALAASLGGTIREVAGEWDDLSYVDTEASGELDGVPWRAWARTRTDAPTETAIELADEAGTAVAA